jgi:nucleoside-diphosphate-sugar epimerase
MKITIIACGWLGLPLGEYLVFKGHEVKGTTTKDSRKSLLEIAGIIPYVFKMSPNIECENFGELIKSDVIIINIPPRIAIQGDNFHFTQIQNLTKHIKNYFTNKKLPNIIYVSSTSVYPDANQTATEISVINDNSVLIKVENLLKENFDNVIILRSGGLMGYDRFPGKYYAGKPFDNWASGVNYVHQDDMILIINHLINTNICNEIFNIVAPIHPMRKEIIIKNCVDLGLEMPFFIDPATPIPFKIISSEKLIFKTNYQFKYANPLDFFYKK